MTALVDLYHSPTHPQFVEWIAKEYGLAANPSDHGTNKHKTRRDEMGERVRLYRDDATKDIVRLIESIWTRPDLREQLCKYLGVNATKDNHQPTASSQNISARIVDTVANLYDKPAARTLTKNQDKFKLDEARLRLHEITQDYHRLLWLCNDVLVWQFDGVDGKTKLRVVTPDIFDAVPNPGDVTVMAGVLLEVPRVTMLDPNKAGTLPRWELWDDTYRYLINAKGQLVDEQGNPATKPTAHDLGRIPGVLLHRREPSDRCLDPRAGRDIGAAHRAVVLLNILLLRLAKTQGDKQPVLQGNLASVSKGQTADGENPLVLPPDVTLEMLNTVTDPQHLLKTKREVLTGTGGRYGISYEQLTAEDNAQTAGTAKLYLARREKLLELRTEQGRRALVNEAEVITLIGYDPIGMKVDHQEQALPQDPTEKIALIDLRMRLGMDSPVRALMREDPDLTRDEAVTLMKQNIADWAAMIKDIRALNIPLSATVANPGNNPQINGSDKVVEKLDFGATDGAAPAPPQNGNPSS